MLGEATKGRLAGLELPLLVPLIFYLQSTLTAVVQALVFSLLTSVFIKMSLDTESKNSKVENEELIVKQLAESIQRKTL
ncbi:MAG: hypothetical protein LBD11_01720 [Candidatus Peribacteria bacterium]|jgi:hypothetical protein|nr:hypothetical protein [Candidatus Peribacteria bacterium]